MDPAETINETSKQAWILSFRCVGFSSSASLTSRESTYPQNDPRGTKVATHNDRSIRKACPLATPFLEFDLDIVHQAGVQYQAEDTFSRRETGGSNKKHWNTESVMMIFDKEDTQNKNSEEGSDEDEIENHWEIDQKPESSVPVILPLTKANKEYIPIL